MSQAKEIRTSSGISKRRGAGITIKLVAAVVASVIIAMSVLLITVYNKMSQTLLEKSEEILRTTTDKTLQETRAWMNQTLTMLEMQRDTIEYSDMDISEMQEYIKHTVNQNADCMWH